MGMWWQRTMDRRLADRKEKLNGIKVVLFNNQQYENKKD